MTKATDLRQKDAAGLETEVKTCRRPTSACACRRPRNN
jgi:hypothetical protein